MSSDENRASSCFYRTKLLLPDELLDKWCSWIALLLAEEEAAEVKKSKLYRPATKFVPVSQHVSPVSFAESKKSVSLSCDVCIMV